jgi:Cobalamin-independent synthase, Catalytic domain
VTGPLTLPEAAATGIGSLPGTEIREAVRTVLGELPDLPHLPELPARGPGADLLGRSAGLLVDLPVDLWVGRWRLASHPGRDARRTADLWARDLDALTDEAAQYQGPLKIQAAGVWSLAAGLDLPVGGRVLRDPGAVRELAESLGEGLARHVRDVAARVPGARVLLQLDEPSLPAVLGGQVPTESGLHMLPPVPADRAEQVLRQVIAAAGAPVVVHCCAPEPPLGLLRSAGAAGVAVDLDLVKDLDPLGELIDSGGYLFAGAAPATGPGLPEPVAVAGRVTDLWRRLGFPLDRLPARVVVTPACGLAGASPEHARAALRACREAARRLQ